MPNKWTPASFKNVSPKIWLALSALIALTLVTFYSAYHAQYVLWDDDKLILENTLLKLPFWQATQAFFTSFYYGDYIPLTLLSFWTEVHFFGLDPRVPHLINLGLHVGNILLLWILLRRWQQPATFCLWVVTVFALHPWQVESVLWISERKGLLATGFLFLGALAAQKSHKTTRGLFFWFAYVLCFVLAFTAKAHGILWPLVLCAADRFFQNRPWPSTVFRHGPVFLLALVLSALRIQAYRESVPGVLESMTLSYIFEWPLRASQALAFYLTKTIWPVQFSILYPSYSLESSTWIWLAGFIAFLIFVMMWIRQHHTWRTAFIFWAFWFVCFLLPVLHFVPRLNFVNDRYMYVPLIALAALFYGLLENLKPLSQRQWVIFTCGLALTLAVLSQRQSQNWLNNKTLWSDTVIKNSNNALAYNNLGLAHYEHREWEAALTAFGYGLQVPLTSHFSILNNRGLVYIAKAQEITDSQQKTSYLIKAQIDFEESLKHLPKPSEAYSVQFNLARIHLQLGHREQAKSILQSLEQELQKTQLDRQHDFISEKIKELKKILD